MGSKAAKRLFAAATVFLLVLGLATGCSHRPQSPLEVMVSQADSLCPASLGAMGTMLAVRYDKKANEVRYVMAVNDDVVSIEQLERDDYARRLLTIMSAREDSRKALEQIARAGAGVAVVYRSATSGRQMEVAFSRDEIEKMCHEPAYSDADAATAYIESMAEMENSHCPQALDDGITLTRVYVDDGAWLNYICTLDEKKYDIAMIDATRPQVANDIAVTFNNPGMKPLLEALVAGGGGLRYRYVGAETQNDVIISFSADDLKAHLDAAAQRQTNNQKER